MVRYRKIWWGLTSLLIWDQSAFPRCLPFSLVALVESALLHRLLDESEILNDIRDDWKHPYPFQAFVAIVAFLMVFRYVSMFLQSVMNEFDFQFAWKIPCLSRTRLRTLIRTTVSLSLSLDLVLLALY
jgi:hypothetical protein